MPDENNTTMVPIQPATDGANWAAIIGLILGITSLGLIWIPVFGIIFPILAIIFSGAGMSKAGKTQVGMGLAVAGLILGIVCTIWKMFIFIL